MESPLLSPYPMSDADAFEVFVKYLHHQREFGDYMYISAVALAVYDYLLNFGREVTLIWLSPWTYTKVLYLVVRYLPFLAFVMFLRYQLYLGVTVASCEWIFPVVVWATTVSTFTAEVIMMIRTWAVWGRDKRVAAFFLTLCCLYIGLATAGNVKFNRSVVLAEPPYPGYRGCLLVQASTSLTYDYVMLVVMEFFVCVLTAWSAVLSSKTGTTNRLSAIIHRDGILFYLYLLVGSVANVIFFTAPVIPPELHVAFVPICLALYTNLTSRVVLNIREVAREGFAVETQLHEYKDDEGELAVIPLSLRTRQKEFR